MIRIEINGRPFVIEVPEGHSIEIEDGKITIKPPFGWQPWYYFPGQSDVSKHIAEQPPYAITYSPTWTDSLVADQFPYFGGIPTNGNTLVC